MAMDDQMLRKRLFFRSWHRGSRELDLILGGFAVRHLAGLSPDQLDQYGRLLENSDPDIYDWLTGCAPWPHGIGLDLRRLLTAGLTKEGDP
jgi:antitoxin CptB